MASYTLDDGDLVQTNLVMRLYGQRLMNTFHWIFNPSTGSVDGPIALNALNNELDTNVNWYYTKLRPRVTSDMLIDYVSSQKIKPSRWRAQTRLLGTLGTNVDAPLPQNVAVSLERYTLAATRGAQGRVQAPGVVATDVDQGLLTGAGTIAWQIVAESLHLVINTTAGNFAPVLAHLTPTGFSINEVVGGIAKEEVRVMRRRTVGRGI